jgi:hypothetical protein
MKTIIVLLISFVSVATHAQTIEGQLIQTTGNSIANSSFSLDYSIGEIAIETISSPSNYLTQGVLQPTIVSVSTGIVVSSSSYIHVYPNPTTAVEGFKINTEDKIEKITVMNTLGQVEYFYSNDIQPTFKGLLILYIKTDQGSYTSKIEVF